MSPRNDDNQSKSVMQVVVSPDLFGMAAPLAVLTDTALMIANATVPKQIIAQGCRFCQMSHPCGLFYRSQSLWTDLAIQYV